MSWSVVVLKHETARSCREFPEIKRSGTAVIKPLMPSAPRIFIAKVQPMASVAAEVIAQAPPAEMVAFFHEYARKRTSWAAAAAQTRHQKVVGELTCVQVDVAAT